MVTASMWRAISSSLFGTPCSRRSFSLSCNLKEKMKILNVAEKNDAAKSIANVMSRGASQRVSVTAIIWYTTTVINVSLTDTQQANMSW